MKHRLATLFACLVFTALSPSVAEAANPYWDGVYAVYDTDGQYVGDNVVECSDPRVRITHPNGRVIEGNRLTGTVGQFVRQ